MLASIRPYATAGVALVGASVIAVAPVVSPPVSDIKVPATVASPVELTVSPIEFYTGLFERTTDNASALIEKILEDPAPILSQIIANQVANVENIFEAVPTAFEEFVEALTTTGSEAVETAFGQLFEGDLYGAVQTLQNAVLPIALPLLGAIGPIIQPFMMAADNINRVIQDVVPLVLLAGPIAVLGPLNATMGAAAFVVQSVVDGVMAGDPMEVVNALINAPGVIADGILNGGYGGLLNAGILSGAGMGPAGPIDVLLTVRQAIAQALVPDTIFAQMTTAASTAEETAPASAQISRTALGDDVVDVEVPTTGLEASTPPPTEPEGKVTPVAETENDNPSDEESIEQVGSNGLSDAALEDEDSTTPSGGTDLTGGNKVTPSAKIASQAKGAVNNTLDKLGVKRGTFGLGKSDADASGNSDADSDSDGGGSDSGDE